MAPKTRHTFNANMMHLGPPGENEMWFGHFAAVLQHWQPSSVLMMNALNGNDPNNAVLIIARLLESWGGFPVYRPYQDGDGAIWRLWPDPADYVRYLKSFNADHLWYQVGNEPGWGSKTDAETACRYYAELMDRAVPANLRLIMPNTPTGTPEWNTIWDGWFDILLNKFAEYASRRVQIKDQSYAQFMFGAHAYAHAGAPFHLDGVDPRLMLYPEAWKRKNWVTKEMIFDDNRTDDYLLLREDWFEQRYHDLHPDRPDMEIMLTECVFDRLRNIELGQPELTAQIDNMAGQRVYGIPTLVEFWRKAAPHQPPEQTCSDQFWWMEEVHPTYYRAFAHFSWTFHDQHPDYWRRKFNFAEWWDLLDLYPKVVTQRSKPTVPTVPNVPYPAAPDDPAWEAGIIHVKNAQTNIREQPNTSATVLTKINPGAIGRIARKYRTPDTWVPVQIGSYYGWLHEPLITQFDVLSGAPTPIPQLPDYRDRLDARQLKLVELAGQIAGAFADAGAPGHGLYLVNDILRGTLDEVYDIVGQ